MSGEDGGEMIIKEPIPGWGSYNMCFTSTCSAIAVRPIGPAPRDFMPYREPVRERSFEPVIHTGNENLLTWQPYVFGALLCTEIILVGYWLCHLVVR